MNLRLLDLLNELVLPVIPCLILLLPLLNSLSDLLGLPVLLFNDVFDIGYLVPELL
jgi:hypothetical protein